MKSSVAENSGSVSAQRCFCQVTKRDEDSSLMQLKEEFRTYEALRREHDAQIVHIAMEAGLRISPEQWSSLLYGDLVHKSHMQSIIDKVLSFIIKHTHLGFHREGEYRTNMRIFYLCF